MRSARLASSFCLLAILPSSGSAAEVTIKEAKILQNAIAVSPDFKLYVEKLKSTKFKDLSTTYSLKIKEMESGKEVNALEWEKEWGGPTSASFSPDARWLAVMATTDTGTTTAKMYYLRSNEMQFNIRQHEQLKFVLFSPDSKHLASAGGYGAAKPDQALWMWDLTIRKNTVIPVGATPTCVAFSPDGKLIAAAMGRYARSKLPALSVCQVAKGKPGDKVEQTADETKGKQRPRLQTQKGRPTLPDNQSWHVQRQGDEDFVALAFSSNSKLLAVADRHGIIKIVDVATHKQLTSFDDMRDEIFSLAFHPKQNLLAATGKDKTIRFWDVGQKRLVSTTKLPKLEYSLQLQFSTVGDQFATFPTFGDNIKLWRIEVKE
jgi:WD40 repeat protein